MMLEEKLVLDPKEVEGLIMVLLRAKAGKVKVITSWETLGIEIKVDF